MTAIVFLDTGPLGLLSNPSHSPGAVVCQNWMMALQMAGRRIIVPEITDYEVRRELIRAQKLRSLRALDRLVSQAEYLPITTTARRLAAVYWASVR